MNSINFTLELDSKIRLYHQLYDKISELIKNGSYKPNSKLPSIRIVASTLDISKNTVTKAYTQLEKNNYIYSEQKRGYFVSDLSKSVPSKQEENLISQEENSIPTVDAIIKQYQKPQDETKTEDTLSVPQTLQTDTPKSMGTESILPPQTVPLKKDTVPEEKNNISSLEKNIAKCLSIASKNICTRPTNENLQLQNQIFKHSLAKFISGYLNINCDENQIVLSTNKDLLLASILNLQSLSTPYVKSNGLGLLRIANKFSNGSATPIKAAAAIPENTDPALKKIFTSVGIPLRKCPADNFGILPDSLAGSDASAIFVTPKNIPEYSVKNQKERNRIILDWTNQASYKYVIEYDTDAIITKDSEARFKSQDYNERVIYINSFENLLPFSFRVAFAVLPKSILADYQQRYDNFSCPVSLFEQQVLSDFIDKGYLNDYLSSLKRDQEIS